MTSLRRTRIRRLQLLFWLLVVCIGVIYVLQTDVVGVIVRTIMFSIQLALLVAINVLHFHQFEDPGNFSRVGTYMSPSLWGAIVIQVILIIMLIEHFLLNGLVNLLSREVIQLIATGSYILVGLLVAGLNVYAPALYRLQELQRQARQRSERRLTQRYEAIAELIENYLVSSNLPSTPEQARSLSSSDTQKIVEGLLVDGEASLRVAASISFHRWLEQQLNKDEVGEPTILVWGVAFWAAIITIFEVASSILGVLEQLKSLSQSP